jgi:hypothetical protein
MGGPFHLGALTLDKTSPTSPHNLPPDSLHASSSAASSSSTPRVSQFPSHEPPQSDFYPLSTPPRGHSRNNSTTSTHPRYHSRRRTHSLSSRRSSQDSDVTLVSSPRHPIAPNILHCASHSEHYPMTSTPISTPYYIQERHDSLPSHNKSGPLIDQVTNEWQNDQDFRESSFESQDSYSHFMSEKDGFRAPGLPAWTRNINIPRRAQRHIVIYTLLLLSAWFSWLYYLRPTWEQEHKLDKSLAAAEKSGARFGANSRPAFTDMIQLRTMDQNFVPAADDQRLIFIGDVHGCSDERMFTGLWHY